MNRKQWIMMTGVALVFISVAVCVVIVFNCHVQTIYLELKTGATLINVRSMIGVLLTKLILSTILGVSGLYCLYLYYQTLGKNQYLALAAAFFLSAGIIMTIMDYKVIFYASAISRRIWLIGSDIFIVMLSALLMQMMHLRQHEQPDRRIAFFYWAAHTALVLIILFSTPKQSWILLRWYGWFSCLITATKVIMSVRRRSLLPDSVWIVLMILLNLFILFVGSYKLNTFEDLYTTYVEFTQYFLLVYMQFILALVVRFQRKDILLGRTELRRLQEAQLYEQMIVRNIMINNYRTIDEFYRRCQDIADSSKDSRDQLLALSGDMEVVTRNVFNVLPYSRLQNIALKPDFSQTGLDIVFYYVQSLLLKNNTMKDTQLLINCPPDCYVSCDTNLLIRACHTLITVMVEMSASNHIDMTAVPLENEVEIRLRTDIQDAQRRATRRLIRIMHRKGTDFQNVMDEDVSLTIARVILSLHDASIKAELNQNHLLLSWRLPRWKDEDTDIDTIATYDSNETSHSVHVALVSNSSMQINFIQACLSHSFYSLHVFKQPNKLTDYMQSHRINVIIVGRLTVNATSIEVCRAIRKSYSMGLMPIILIQPSDALSLESDFVQLVNDILLEPFSHTELSRRVLSLSMLQRSTEDLRRSRLEFLQSQMNPHFIFNSISAIMPLCIRDPQKAYSLLGSFSDYLRGNLFPKQRNKPILVHEEIDLVRAYLTLENVRLDNRIIFEIIEEYDDDSMIYPLLIEPVIENCVKHGLRTDSTSSKKRLLITLSIIQRDSMLDVLIRDDGVGFDPSRIEEQQPKPMGDHRSIGLSNLNARLNLYYNTSLNIQSTIGEGTSISFTIPKHHMVM